MIKAFVLLSILFVQTSAYPQKGHALIQQPVIDFFEGLSSLDENEIRNPATADFQLLEEGEVWTMDTLLSKVMLQKGRSIKRINHLKFITTEQKGDMAWVSYENRADFSLGEKKQSVLWLESAVLVKTGKGWKIRMLHSTRIRDKASQ